MICRSFFSHPSFPESIFRLICSSENFCAFLVLIRLNTFGTVDKLHTSFHIVSQAGEGAVVSACVNNRIETIHQTFQIIMIEIHQLINGFRLELVHAFCQLLCAVIQLSNTIGQLTAAILQSIQAIGQGLCAA